MAIRLQSVCLLTTKTIITTFLTSYIHESHKQEASKSFVDLLVLFRFFYVMAFKRCTDIGGACEPRYSPGTTLTNKTPDNPLKWFIISDFVDATVSLSTLISTQHPLRQVSRRSSDLRQFAKQDALQHTAIPAHLDRVHE